MTDAIPRPAVHQPTIFCHSSPEDLPSVHLTLSDLGLGDLESETPTLPILEVQIHELRLAKAIGDIPFAFSPGDLVRYRRVVGPMRQEFRDKLVLMFWRWLDWGNPTDLARLPKGDSAMHFSAPDCLIAEYMLGSVQFRVSQSSFLEPFQPPVTSPQDPC